MIKRVHGTISGNTIIVDEDLCLSDGHKVEVLIESHKNSDTTWGSGLERCAGAFADSWSDEDDRVFEEIRKTRRVDSRPEAN